MIAHRGLVLHVQQGTEGGTDSWFDNPASQVSAHFGAAKDGTLQQFVDTDDEAWAESAGNRTWVSVECEGMSGDSLTAGQLGAIAKLLAWMHTAYGTPLQVVDDPTGTGLGWHGMGGVAWGGHLDCPGDPIKAQRAEIIRQARLILMIVPVPAPPPAAPVHFEGDHMTKLSVHVPTLDDQGNGSVPIPGVAGRVVSVMLNGNDPNHEGYDGNRATFESSARGSDELLVIQGGKPHTGFDVNVWVTG
jgi:hypothetical protein